MGKISKNKKGVDEIRELIITSIEEIEEGELVGGEITLLDTKQLEFYVQNGHIESLVEQKAYTSLSPVEKVHTFVQALDNRLATMRSSLMPLGRSPRTRDAYIQVLNAVHDMERLKEELLSKYYAKIGNRQIDKESKGRKVYF